MGVIYQRYESVRLKQHFFNGGDMTSVLFCRAHLEDRNPSEMKCKKTATKYPRIQRYTRREAPHRVVHLVEVWNRYGTWKNTENCDNRLRNFQTDELALRSAPLYLGLSRNSRSYPLAWCLTGQSRYICGRRKIPVMCIVLKASRFDREDPLADSVPSG